jgi:exodeoxyribonuclease-3
MRVISFCAEGLREAAKLGFYDWLARQDADFVCIQDLRCAEYDLQDDVFFPRDYNAYFFDDVDGRDNGVAIYCRALPKAIMTGLGFAEFDMQGRYIQADYEDISIGCLLAPQGDGEASVAARTRFRELLGPHLQKVRNKRRDYIICGSWGMAPQERDVQHADQATGQPGFLPEERAWFSDVFAAGYTDAHREVSTDGDIFTFWPDNAGAGGWRVDLQIVSDEISDCVEHAAVYTGERFSRHAPLIIDYDLEL